METQKTTIEWQKIKVIIDYSPNKYGSISHVAIKAGEPLPVTETGYKSLYYDNNFIVEYENIETFVKALLDDAMNSKEWKKYIRDKNQLSLF